MAEFFPKSVLQENGNEKTTAAFGCPGYGRRDACRPYVYSGEQLLFSYTDSNVAGSQGFISLTSNKCMISFDDVAIYKLPMDSGGKLTGEETGDGDIGNWDDWNS